MATPDPVPPLEGPALILGEFALIAGALAIVCLVAFGFLLTWALMRTANYTAPAMVTVALSMLTLAALVGFVVTQSEVLGTIAATGVGALAGSVTAMFTGDSHPPGARHAKTPDPLWGKKRPPEPQESSDEDGPNPSESL